LVKKPHKDLDLQWYLHLPNVLGVYMTHFYVFRSIWCMFLQGTSIIQQRQATFLTKSVVLTKRSMINMYRDIGYYWLRFVIYIGLFLTIGTIFFNVGYSYASIQVSGDSEYIQ
jgi:hypothetical protein